MTTPVHFMKLLFKLISSQCSKFKEQFLQENGVTVLKGLLKIT